MLVIVLVIAAAENLYNKVLSEAVADEEYLHMNSVSVFQIHSAVSSVMCVIIILLYYFMINADVLIHFITTLKYLDRLIQC